jgi:hypothetical protein
VGSIRHETASDAAPQVAQARRAATVWASRRKVPGNKVHEWFPSSTDDGVGAIAGVVVGLYPGFAAGISNGSASRITDESSLRAAIGRQSHVQIRGRASISLVRPILITRDVILEAPGQGGVTISGAGVTRIFNVATGASLTLKNIELFGGVSTNGGAIWNDGSLVLINCTFRRNTRAGFGDGHERSCPGAAGSQHQ